MVASGWVFFFFFFEGWKRGREGQCTCFSSDFADCLGTGVGERGLPFFNEGEFFFFLSGE